MCMHAHARVNTNCTAESRGSECHTHSPGFLKLLPFSLPVFIYLWIEGHRPGHKIDPTNHSTCMIDDFIMLHCHSHIFFIHWPEITRNILHKDINQGQLISLLQKWEVLSNYYYYHHHHYHHHHHPSPMEIFPIFWHTFPVSETVTK